MNKKIVAKPHLFEKGDFGIDSNASIKWGKVSDDTIKEGVKIIKAARKIREEAQKEFGNNAAVCF